MDLIKPFGNYLSKELQRNPARARKILTAGFRAFGLYQHIHPDRRLSASQDYIADLSMRTIIRALSHPKQTAMTSLFVPAEPLQCAGITPYSVEALSSFLSGTHIERVFLDVTDAQGFPETMCSFHRIFLGAALSGLMPDPPFIIYTNLACDANMLTFPYLKRKLEVPAFYIDVPYEHSEEAVQEVASQIREMCVFLEDMTHRPIREEDLTLALERSNTALRNYHMALQTLQHGHLANHMTCEMYGVFTGRLLMGSPETVRHSELLLQDARDAAVHNEAVHTLAGKKSSLHSAETSDSASRSVTPSGPLRIAWIHMMPFMQPSMRELCNFSDRFCFTASDLVYDGYQPVDPAHPYETMARRMVYSAFNGSADARIENARALVRETNAEGAIVFSHWGCKTTIGASTLIRDALQAEGTPVLILDGDGCDPSNSSDGQLVTRMEAFLEMLEERRK